MLEELRESARHRDIESLLRERECFGRATGERLGELAPLDRELGVGPHAADEADAQGFIGGDRLAREDHIESATPAHHPREEEGRARIWHETHTTPRRPKGRGRRGNADVAGDRETETRARGDAVDGRDDRLAHLADRGDRGMVAAAELVTELEIAGLLDHGEAVGQVLARRKRAAGAGDHDSAYRGVRCAIVERRIEGLGERLVECVQHIGPIEREHGDCAVAFDAKRREVRHLPLKLAFRLFTKASTPSFLSSVAKSR